MENNDKIISSVELQEELKKLPPQQFFSTGMKYLDKLVEKMAEGDFWVIAAEQKQGKTQLAVSISTNLIKQGVNCLWLEAELSYREFFKRFGAELPVFYLPNRQLRMPTLTWIELKIKEAKDKFNTKVIFIDDLGMIADEEMYKHKHAIEIYGIRMQRIKELCLKYRVCIVGIAHVHKEAAKRKKAGMDTSDIKGAMDLAYRADTLIGIERLVGTTATKTIQEMDNQEEFLFSRDCYIYVMDCRRTGSRRIRIKCYIDDDGFIKEYE